MALSVWPQHAVAVSRCQVFSIRTDTDGPDARPALRHRPVPWFICVHIGHGLWIQQRGGVSVYVDYIQEILHSGDRGNIHLQNVSSFFCTLWDRTDIDAKLTLLRTFWKWTRVWDQPPVCHSLTVLSAEQLRNTADDKPAAVSPGTSGNTWARTTEMMSRWRVRSINLRRSDGL